MYNYGSGRNLNSNSISSATENNSTVSTRYGRVVDVVLDETSPDFSTFGGPLSIGGIRYRALDLSSSESDPSALPFAFMYDTGVKVYPVKGEIVEIFQAPDESIGLSVTSRKTYYKASVNIWNQNNHNAYPDTTQTRGNADLGNGVIENVNVQSLSPRPGDIIIEGRTGNTVRIGGYLGNYTPEERNGSPYIFLRAGQGTAPTSADTALEDINADGTSVYLATGQIIPLQLGTNKRKSYIDPPVDAHVYEGRQFVANSDRVVINSRAGDTLVSARRSIGLSGKSVNLDGVDYIGVDARKIYIGERGKEENEPAVLGAKNEEVLLKILEALSAIGNTLQNISKAPSPATTVSALIQLGPEINEYTRLLREMIPSTKSTKVFIDSGKKSELTDQQLIITSK